MARIRDSSIEAVRQNADFVAVVEERTALRKAGARLVGRCPFHEERTASFSVNPLDKLYHCFGCQKGGDMIEFVRETQGLDFVGAIEWLADRFRIPLEYEESSAIDDGRRKRRERLLALLEAAASFYERYLWESPAGSFARDYLAGRGLGEDVAREFRLGLAHGGATLTRGARAKGFTDDELRAAGLSGPRGDYFQRRLVFPLANARGQVLGFQARRLHEDDPLKAKYVNTAESELFKKGAIVYGFDKARAAIKNENRVCVVEGNTDVLALRQAGFVPVVACMGTALTEDQLRELERATTRLWLAFDGDAAGTSATLRGMELAVKRNFDVRVVSLPPGIDPADDPTGFEARLAAAKPYVLHRAQIEAERAPDPESGRRAVEAFLGTVRDSIDRRDAWRWANDHFGMPIEIRGGGTASSRVPPSPRVVATANKFERGALAGVIAYRSLVPKLAEIPPELFRDETNRALRDHLVSGTPAAGEVLALLAELDAWAPEEGIDEPTAETYLVQMKIRGVRTELQQAELERVPELTEMLAQLHEAIRRLGERPATPD
ncbi:MAG TPA: DNA primase [Gaiellaceae bacterium]|jgi:DNA primase|nr:DNA primase [Gaiellaceae bacterium]